MLISRSLMSDLDAFTEAGGSVQHSMILACRTPAGMDRLCETWPSWSV